MYYPNYSVNAIRIVPYTVTLYMYSSYSCVCILYTDEMHRTPTAVNL